MTETEWQELIDLMLDGSLPTALRARVEAHLAADPSAAAQAQSLQATLARLQAAPAERPDPWFVEHALDSLLRDHAGAVPTDPLMTENSH